jgi:tetratricopeptide (TPR) repeat protein
LGRFDEAQRIWERNTAEHPDNSYNWGFGYHFFLRRDYQRALNVVLKHANSYPELYDDVLARCYEELGHYQEALEAIRRKRSRADGPDPIAKEGHILAQMGRDAEARERLDELSSMSRYRYISPVYPAIVNTGLGDLTAAFTWLEKAYEDRSECMVFSQSYGLGVDPYWDPLRGHPRYTELLRRVGLLDRLQPLSTTATPVEER